MYVICTQHMSLLFPAPHKLLCLFRSLSLPPASCSPLSPQRSAPAPLLAPACLPQHLGHLGHLGVVLFHGPPQWGLAPLVQHTNTDAHLCHFSSPPPPCLHAQSLICVIVCVHAQSLVCVIGCVHAHRCVIIMYTHTHTHTLEYTHTHLYIYYPTPGKRIQQPSPTAIPLPTTP